MKRFKHKYMVEFIGHGFEVVKFTWVYADNCLMAFGKAELEGFGIDYMDMEISEIDDIPVR